jgi:hypothetical protein
MKNLASFIIILLSCQGVISQETERDSTNKIIAEIQGRKITLSEKNNLTRLIFGELLKQFAGQNKIEATESDIDAFINKIKDAGKAQILKMEETQKRIISELNDSSLNESDRKRKQMNLQMTEKRLNSMKSDMQQPVKEETRQLAIGFIKSWKTNKALYEIYGGRVIFQQNGPEPISAYTEFLKEHEKNGTFRFMDKDSEKSFWYYFLYEKHRFYSKEDGEKFIKTPWWLMDQPSQF